MHTDEPLTARLILPGERTVSLSSVAGMIKDAADFDGSLKTEEATVADISIRGASIRITLELRFEEGATVLVLRIAKAGAHVDATGFQAILARIVHALASKLPVTHVIWDATGARIPRDRFVATLNDAFGPREPQGPAIAPRRVSRPVTHPHRPMSRRVSERLADKPIRPRPQPWTRSRAGDVRQDAHVIAYERNIRQAICDAPDAIEIRSARADARLPVEARLSTWAMSLSAAAISLPVALPMMAYHLAKGEDMRGAALTLGLAGFFVTLDNTGMVAVLASAF